jgi:hypothetical protein
MYLTSLSFAFYFIGKIEFVTILLGGKVHVSELHQCMSHVVGSTTLRPFAPALAQSAASSKMDVTRSRTEGQALSKDARVGVLLD